jgi:hypothetical protein
MQSVSVLSLRLSAVVSPYRPATVPVDALPTESYTSSLAPLAMDSPEPARLSGWKVATLAALSLVPVLGLVGCSQAPPPPPATCVSQPIQAERVTPSDAKADALDALQHLSEKGGRCSAEPGVFQDRGWRGEKKLSASQAYDELAKGKSVYIKDTNGKSITLAHLPDLREADALIGRGLNTVMSPEQFEALRTLEDSLVVQGGKQNAFQVLQSLQSGESVHVVRGDQYGFSASTLDDLVIYNGLNGQGKTTFLSETQLANLDTLFGRHSTSAFEAAKNFHRGQPASFSFSGGDWSESLGVRIDGPDDLDEAINMVNNQRAFDQYRLSQPEFQTRLSSEAERTPGLTRNAVSDADSDLSSARRMPQTVEETYTTTEYGYHYGYNFSSGNYEYHYGSHTVTKTRDVENTERTRKVREAESRLSNLESVKRMLPDLQGALKNPQDLKQLESVLDRMSYGADDYALRSNVHRLRTLVHSQQTRPERPPGWVAPSPRVQQ